MTHAEDCPCKDPAVRAAEAILKWEADPAIQSMIPMKLDGAVAQSRERLVDGGIPVTRETALAHYVGIEILVDAYRSEPRFATDSHVMLMALVGFRTAQEVVRPFLTEADFAKAREVLAA